MQLIGDKIARNEGVITAEELAPFLNMEISAKSYSARDDIDESFVLPVLQRLQGIPEVNKVLYQFHVERRLIVILFSHPIHSASAPMVDLMIYCAGREHCLCFPRIPKVGIEEK